MPPEEAGAADGGFDVAAFLAANPPDAEPAAAAPAAAPDPEGEQTNEAEEALLASLDAKEETDEAEEAAAEEEPAAEDETTAEPRALDVKALEAALRSKNPEAFLAALGDDAEHVLGTKAHRTLRIAARDVKASREKLLAASAELKERFGEPAAIRKAAADGDADAVVEGVEKFFGASWESLIKFVNASFAGKPERLEAKAKAKADQEKAEKEASEAAAKKQREESEALAARQTEAAAQLKTMIGGVVKKTHPTLVALPGINDLVFEKMKSEFRKGVNTPAKALAAVLVDLRAQHAALSKAFAPPAKGKGTKEAPAPRETGKRGREMTEEELIADFLRENKP